MGGVLHGDNDDEEDRKLMEFTAQFHLLFIRMHCAFALTIVDFMSSSERIVLMTSHSASSNIRCVSRRAIKKLLPFSPLLTPRHICTCMNDEEDA